MRPIIVLTDGLVPQHGGVRSDGPRRQTDNPGAGAGKAAKPAQPETVESLQSALNALEERKGSLERAQQSAGYRQLPQTFSDPALAAKQPAR